MTPKSNPTKTTKPAASERVIYLYAISQVPRTAAPAIASEGIDGLAPVEAMRSAGFLCWISRVAKTEFAEELTDRMQDLEWLAAAGVRHQRAVAEISDKLTTLPARFGTVFLTDKSLEQHVKTRASALRKAFGRVAAADEWGIKVFALAQPKKNPKSAAASGVDYLKQKAEMLRPRGSRELDEEVQHLADALKKLSVASRPGGKASAGQPGLLWHGSFLVRRKNRKKLEETLQKYAGEWDGVRRIDCSGPWPPYSFVEEHGD